MELSVPSIKTAKRKGKSATFYQANKKLKMKVVPCTVVNEMVDVDLCDV